MEEYRTSTVVQWLKPVTASHQTPVQVQATPFPIQLPANNPRKAAQDGSSTWASLHIQELEEAQASWLQPGSILATVTIWGVHQELEALQPFSLSPFAPPFSSL